MMASAGAARPRLLVLASTYPRWAGDHEPGFVHELARRLTGDFEVAVLTPHATGAREQENLDGVQVWRYRYAPSAFETLVNDGGIVTNLRRSPWKWLLLPGFVFGQLWAVGRILRRWRPDVVHAHWLIPQGLIIALLGRCLRAAPPFLVTSHGADLFALRARPLQALKRDVARRAAAITVVSGAMVRELERIGVPRDKVSVQPMGVDLSGRFVVDVSVPRSPDEIIFVGRLVEKKGLRHLLDAMPAIVAAHPNAFLTVVGFGPEESACRAQAKRLGLDGKVDFVGAVGQTELPGMYRRAALFVAPFVQAASGDQEGLGLVMVEAVGCGCPVVVSDLPAVRQVFPDSSEAALVSPGNSAELAAAVIQALAQPRPPSESLQSRLRAMFDWPAVAAGYATLLRSIMRTAPTPDRTPEAG